VTQEECCGVKKVLGMGKGAEPYLGQIWARSEACPNQYAINSLALIVN